MEPWRKWSCLVLSCLLTLYTAVMSFEILFPFGLWVFEPDWLLNHSQSAGVKVSLFLSNCCSNWGWVQSVSQFWNGSYCAVSVVAYGRERTPGITAFCTPPASTYEISTARPQHTRF